MGNIQGLLHWTVLFGVKLSYIFIVFRILLSFTNLNVLLTEESKFT